MNTEQHDDLEAIRQLKARYLRLMDTKQWDRWGDCFMPDIIAVFEGAPRASSDQPMENRVEGSELLVGLCRELLADATTIHQVYMPEIELINDTTATAVWAMFDNVQFPTCNFKGWGHYQDSYVKEDGQWKIQKLHLTRLHTSEEWL